MIVAFFKYSDNIKKLQQTIRNVNGNAKFLILGDDGFLPDEFVSPYEYFAYGQELEQLEERELYYSFLQIPEFWEIRSVGTQGVIYDMSCKKADIYFTKPIEKKNVQRVEWCMENSWVYRIDYYNKYALKYASEFLDMNGQVESKVFFSLRNQEALVEQPINDVVTLLENGKTKAFFLSYFEFIEYYLDEICQKDKRILFIQDDEEFELLNMKPERNTWGCVLFMSDELMDRYVHMGGKNGRRFYAVPEAYPLNRARGEALILTASDQLEEIEYLIRNLPEITFHIAANTQVSDKLLRLGDYVNVSVYPQINMRDLDALWEKCDFYLDINYYWEIHNAIDTAHYNNLLILGFENTLHHSELVAEECVFLRVDSEKMALTIKGLVNQVELVQEKIIKQQEKKRKIWENLKKFIW